MNTMYTCAIRKVSTGYKISAFQGDNLQHLHSICTTLLQSPNYSGCYIVCTDWQGGVLFNLQPHTYVPAPGFAPAPYVQPLPRPAAAPAPPPPPSWDAYYAHEAALQAQNQLPAYRRPSMPPSHTGVIDAQFEEIPALPPARR